MRALRALSFFPIYFHLKWIIFGLKEGLISNLFCSDNQKQICQNRLIISLFWAIANDLIPKDFAGRTLGFTAIAFLIGSGLARSSGFLVDWLNIQNHNWGYYFLLLLSSFSFFISPLIVLKNSVEEDQNF